MKKAPFINHLNSFTKKSGVDCRRPEEGLQNDLILRAARGEETERAPVWVMRQAGRYLPEFRAVREKHEFFECCRTPALACEITMQPIRRFRGLLDAAIIFSDILVIPQAMGMEVEMLPAKGPSFPEPLKEPADVERLRKKVDVDRELGYVFEAIKMTRTALDGEVPLIGFCGAPWTLMAYMIEGGGSRTFEKAKRWLFQYREQSLELLERIADVCIDFLVGQVRAGAQLLQVFDSWAGELSPHDFRTFALPYLRKIAAGVRDALSRTSTPSVPLICFAKGALGHSLPEVAKSGYDVVALDWQVEPQVARRVVELSMAGQADGFKKAAGANECSHRIALQGNLDPAVLYAGHDAIEREVDRMCRARKGGFGGGGAWIANLGHGITPGVDPEALRFFLKCVHKHSREVASLKDDE